MNRTPIITYLLLAALPLWWTACSPEQIEMYGEDRLTGVVTFADTLTVGSAPAAAKGAEVRLLYAEQLLQTTKTNDLGKFAFSGIDTRQAGFRLEARLEQGGLTYTHTQEVPQGRNLSEQALRLQPTFRVGDLLLTTVDSLTGTALGARPLALFVNRSFWAAAVGQGGVPLGAVNTTASLNGGRVLLRNLPLGQYYVLSTDSIGNRRYWAADSVVVGMGAIPSVATLRLRATP
jgi:hypothetical protein